jgi:hypothetical protein
LKLTKLRSEKLDEEISEREQDPNSEIERHLGALISRDISDSLTHKDAEIDDTGLSILEQWEDEYKLLRGGGLQWTTNIAYRPRKDRQKRPNSEDNFIHTAIHIQVANVTANAPEVRISGKKKHEKQSAKLTHLCRYNDSRNKFYSAWKEIVRDYVSYGPAIIKVCWDSEWIGGSGPDRFIGDVRVESMPKEDTLFDPAVTDLEKNLQNSRFVGFRSRQFISYVQKRWEKYANAISYETVDDNYIDEGTENESVYLYEIYYKGFPEYMPDERQKELRERAMLQEEQGDNYKARDLYDMANGDVEGVHLAYYCNDILLEYIPYVYDHGLFPVAFSTRYRDLKCQWGYGEIRNIKIPQLLHNKADEIEIEAMCKEGLGGGYFQAGAITKNQLDNIIDNGAKSGMWFPVQDIMGIKERTGVKVPQSITNYKEHKQRMVETVAVNPAIAQGQMPSANAPFKAMTMLSNKVDIKTTSAAEKLKDLLIEVNKLRIKLFEQFYTEERYYRYTDSQHVMHEGTFRNDEMFDVWARELSQEEVLNPQTGQVEIVQKEIKEYYVPDFDIEVTIISKKPDDRDYYTNLAFQLHQLGILTEKHLLFTLEEGRLPDMEEILKDMAMSNEIKAMMQQIQELPEIIRPEIIESMKQAIDQTVQGAMRQMEQQAMAQGQMPQQQ